MKQLEPEKHTGATNTMQATIHGRTLKPVKGDITEQQANAIVNAANPPHEQHRKPLTDQEPLKQTSTKTAPKHQQNPHKTNHKTPPKHKTRHKTTPNNPHTHRGEGHKRMEAWGRSEQPTSGYKPIPGIYVKKVMISSSMGQ